MFFGICLVMMKEESEVIVAGIEKLNDAMMIMVMVVMLAAPFGVFCLMASTFATGFSGIYSYSYFRQFR